MGEDLYQKAIDRLLGLIANSKPGDSGASLRDLCVGVINLEQARTLTMPKLTVAELAELVDAADRDPSEMN